MLRAHAVLAEVSLGYPPLQGRFPRATHPCATQGPGEPRPCVRLACVRHAASVRSEPGSNSHVQSRNHSEQARNGSDKGRLNATPDAIWPKPNVIGLCASVRRPNAAARASLPLSNNVNQRTWRGSDRGCRRAGERAYRPSSPQRQRPFQAGFSPLVTSPRARGEGLR